MYSNITDNSQMDSLENSIVCKEMLKVSGETNKNKIFCEGLTFITNKFNNHLSHAN